MLEKKNTVRFWVGLLLLLSIFFPFVGVIRAGDVQPNFALLGILVFLLSFTIKRYQYVNKRALALFLFFFIFLTLRFIFGEYGTDVKYIFTYALSLTVPFLLWHFLNNRWLDLNLPLLGIITIIYVIVGLVQLKFNQQFLSGILPRAELAKAINVLDTGRGVRSLASEPSVFGKVLTYLNVIYVFLAFRNAEKEPNKFRVFLISIFLLVSNVVLAQSFYAIAIHFFLIFILFAVLSPAALISGMVGAFIFLPSITFSLPGLRLNLIFQAVKSLELEFLMSQGAFARVMNLPMSLYGGIKALPFGFGNSEAYEIGQFMILGKPYIFVIGKRNLGGFIEYFLRFGLIGLAILFIYFKGLIKIGNVKFAKKGVGLFFAISIFMLTMLDGSTADPLAWFIILYLWHESREGIPQRFITASNLKAANRPFEYFN